MAWIQLTEQQQFNNEILDKQEGMHVVFKHSPRCGISSMVLRRFEQSEFFQASGPDFWILDVLKSRDLATFISKSINIRHESPQVLVFQNRKVIHNASHSGINAEEINQISR